MEYFEVKWKCLQEHQKQRSPLFCNLLSFFLGILCLFFAVCWMFQIVSNGIIQLPGPLVPFLDTIFYFTDTYVTSGYPVISAVIYLLLIFYIGLSTLNMVILICEKLPFLSVSPMKKHDTYIGSMVFNVGVFLILTISLNHFAIILLSGYTAGTEIAVLYSNIINNIYGLHYVFQQNIQIYIFFFDIFVFAILNLLYLCYIYLICGRRSYNNNGAVDNNKN